MKNFIIIAFLLANLNVFAQKFDKNKLGTPEQRAKRVTDTLQVKLKLSKEQVAKIYPINLKYAKVMQKEVIETDANTFSKYWKGNGINTDREKELKPLMTPSQWRIYEALRDERKKKIFSNFFNSDNQSLTI
jgi:hypothetical protein